jgi:glycosyltransferase involved in cell wall biosynthesis
MCQLGMEQSRIKIGYDVVDNDYFVRETTTLRLNSTSSHFANPYFLTSNRFIPKKNLFRLLKAYFEYRKIVPKPWDLVLLGDGPLKEEIKNMIYDLGLSNYVHLPGFCQYNELPTYYAFAQAFVHSSTSEQWGLVINEAMASGLPILVSNRCGCAEDLVHTDKNGIKFDPYDIEAITAALVNITTVANEKREEMGVNSLEIIENFKPKHFGENLNLLSVQAMNTNLKPTILARIILKILLRFSTK